MEVHIKLPFYNYDYVITLLKYLIHILDFIVYFLKFY